MNPLTENGPFESLRISQLVFDQIVDDGVNHHIWMSELEKRRFEYTRVNAQDIAEVTCCIGCYKQDEKLDDYLF